MAIPPQLVLGGLKLMAGLFGRKKPKVITPAANLMSQAMGARAAAKASGFHPLTILQNGQTGASTGEIGGNIMASNDLLFGGLDEIMDVASGDAAQRRALNAANLDLAKISAEQARSNVVGVRGPGAVSHRNGSKVGARLASTVSLRPEIETAAGSGVYAPDLSIGDDKAFTERVLGVDMPFDTAERKEAAAGEVLGELATLEEYIWKWGKKQRYALQNKGLLAGGPNRDRSGLVYRAAPPKMGAGWTTGPNGMLQLK